MKHKDEWLLAWAIALPVDAVWAYVYSGWEEISFAGLAFVLSGVFALSIGAAYYSRARGQSWLFGFALAMITCPAIAFGTVWLRARRQG